MGGYESPHPAEGSDRVITDPEEIARFHLDMARMEVRERLKESRSTEEKEELLTIGAILDEKAQFLGELLKERDIGNKERYRRELRALDERTLPVVEEEWRKLGLDPSVGQMLEDDMLRRRGFAGEAAE